MLLMLLSCQYRAIIIIIDDDDLQVERRSRGARRWDAVFQLNTCFFSRRLVRVQIIDLECRPAVL